MCQALPGPRCSHHALEHFMAKQQELESLWAKAGNSKRKTYELTAKIDAATRERDAAETDYNATPDGIRHLRSKLEEARQKKSKGEIESYSWKLDEAIADRQAAKIAGKIAKNANYMNPASSQRVQQALAMERAANSRLARLVNDPHASMTEKKRVQREAEEAKKVRVQETTRFLLQQRGISQPRMARYNDLPQGAGAYIKADAHMFGRRSMYFPAGAFVEVTNIERDSIGNLRGKIEGIKDVVLPRNQKFIVAGD